MHFSQIFLGTLELIHIYKFLSFNWDLLHAKLNSHYKAWSYKKKKHKKIKAYKKSLHKETTANKCL